MSSLISPMVFIVETLVVKIRLVVWIYLLTESTHRENLFVRTFLQVLEAVLLVGIG